MSILRATLRRYKLLRRRAIGASYLYRSPPRPLHVSAINGKPIILTVAYRSVWALTWQFRYAHHNLRSDAVRLIADNSPDDDSAAEIERLCEQFGALYVKLPFNRFSLGRPRDASLSHAVALNWVWQKLVRPADPPWCAIIDHDLIPMRPINLENQLGDQPFFGAAVEGTSGGWQLWPGYSVYSRHIIQSFQFNFWPDASHNLDTGGSNYNLIFKHHSRANLRLLNFHRAPVGPVGDWWHLGNASGYNPHEPGWRDAVEKKLTAAICDLHTGSRPEQVTLPPP